MSFSERYVPNTTYSPFTQTVSSEPLMQYLEDESVPTIDFSAKKFVISGASPYREQIIERLIALGAKKQAKPIKITDYFIIGEDVGPSKIKDAEIIKQETPDSFHIISQEAVAVKDC